jgi:hypothetical protein
VNTRIEYLYRDASNYKQFVSVVLSGEITAEEIRHIADCLDSGEFFVPAQVGLEELQSRMPSFPDPDVDHVWHELDVQSGITLTEDAPTIDLDVHRFAGMFTGQWDLAAGMKRLGLPPPWIDCE